jgi:AcrR family transcriptional regulator
MSSPGLRERKKQKTRWAIQEHALRLFAEQGYDATTVEQIAAAAEVSPSTFFRYFPTKEDVVLADDYDPLLLAAFEAVPPELDPVAAMRQASRSAFGQIDVVEQAKVLERTKLTLSVPALRARSLENFAGTIALLAEPIARRLGRAPSDLGARTLAGACLGAMLVAIFEWVETDGAKPLPDLIDEALGLLESGFTQGVQA